MLETGKKCKWEDIKVGEVFAVEGCWQIGMKLNNSSIFLIAEDGNDKSGLEFIGTISESAYDKYFGFKDSLVESLHRINFYKLPKKVQALWKEE